MSKELETRISDLEVEIANLEVRLSHLREMTENPPELPEGWMIVRIDDFDTANAGFGPYTPGECEDAFFVVPKSLGLPSFEKEGMYAQMGHYGVTLTEDRPYEERPTVHHDWAPSPEEAVEVFLLAYPRLGRDIVTFWMGESENVSYLDWRKPDEDE